ncbi:MAG: UBP-type zinc finger domain-containing protein [Myxococcaceae bacterium]
MAFPCEHLDEVGSRHRAVHPSSSGCSECLASGSTWVHLRLCMACGHVGCCDQSPNRHATGHFLQYGHPVVKSFEPGEDWAYCYVDRAFADAVPAFPQETPAQHFSPPPG